MSDIQNFDEPKFAVESESVEFKAAFDASSKQDWCELIKDIVAIGNSGGGVIIFGINNDGTPSDADMSHILEVDPADVANKLHSYTEHAFSDFRLLAATKAGHPVAALILGGNRFPIVFTSPGTYPTGPTQKSAFAKGTVYFRHSAKSEPGTTEDLRAALEKELSSIKDFWLQGISKVVTAPPGTVVQVVQQDVSLRDTPNASPIRLTTDKDAPAFRAIQSDMLYPYRQKELIAKVNEHIGKKQVSQYDVLSIRYFHKTDDNPTFTYKSQWGPRQYSPALLEWLTAQYDQDNEFFRKAREALSRKLRGEDI